MNTITIDRAVVEQALEALEFVTIDFFMLDPISPGRESTIKAITALRAALAEPVQEPVAWRHKGAGHFTVNPLVSKFSEWEPLYTAPPQRKPLTEEVAALTAQRDALLEALKNVTVHLIAAHGLLHRGGKKAAASDAMFSMMLADYEKSFEVGRAAIKAVEGTK